MCCAPTAVAAEDGGIGGAALRSAHTTMRALLEFPHVALGSGDSRSGARGAGVAQLQPLLQPLPACVGVAELAPTPVVTTGSDAEKKEAKKAAAIVTAVAAARKCRHPNSAF